ncbi:MAG: hypothetical protein M3Q12_03905 [Pseudomonadota bacterium]|nr:hypothetical protein [Pseudomonadota bacterium]
MTRFAYWFCFSLAALSALRGWSAWLLQLIGVQEPYFLGALHGFSFSLLVPPMLRHLTPWVVNVVLAYLMLFLLLRRIWLLAIEKQRAPASFRGIPKGLGYIGVFSFFGSALALVLTIVLRGGSGVPAGLILLPALICVPWSVFLTELLSFRGSEQSAV